MQYYPFDSRKKLYKSHFGAVVSGESLKLRLLLHNDAKCYNAYLRVLKDGEQHFVEYKMTPAEYLEDYRFFDCELSFSEGLYWYNFKYDSPYGEFYVTRCDGSTGFVSRDGESWQLTVYDENFVTPKWLYGGIIYQIFPDRFYNSGKEKKNIPQSRYMVKDWSQKPEYRQDDNFKCLGNDFFGGDLCGIAEKLDYLSDLGVTCIYLNPIFEASSNHRYNTADYLKIDPVLGDENDLKALCKKAEKHNIAIILDGVFSHTGDDSVYFNKYGTYDSVGAYNSKESPYFNWFKFDEWPDKYSSWWGISTLPEVVEENPDYNEFITGENGVIRHWLKCGIKGWRLDVADELPDQIIDNIRSAMKTEDPDSFLLGEVWEDASNKTSYGYRRRFVRGKQFDSVMNYPFAAAIINFVCGGDSKYFINSILNVLENYPPQVTNVLMNHIGTHDTSRILTRLGDTACNCGDRSWQSERRLSTEEYQNGITLLKLAIVLQYTLNGVPSVYYGDEVGVEGYGDPFCRGTFPWGNENKELLNFYINMGKYRHNCDCFKEGEFIPVFSGHNCVSFVRKGEIDSSLTAVNTGENDVWFELPDDFKNNPQVFLGNYPNSDGWLCVHPKTASIIKIEF